MDTAFTAPAEEVSGLRHKLVKTANVIAGVVAFATPTVLSWMTLGPFGALTITAGSAAAGLNFVNGKYLRGALTGTGVFAASLFALDAAKETLFDPSFPSSSGNEAAQKALDQLRWKRGASFEFSYSDFTGVFPENKFKGTINIFNRTLTEADTPSDNKPSTGDACHYAIGAVVVPYTSFWTGNATTFRFNYKSSERAGVWTENLPVPTRENGLYEPSACRRAQIGFQNTP